jgi:uncharacterized membrane protein YeiB
VSSTSSSPTSEASEATTQIPDVRASPAARASRILGIDFARGIALVGMIAVHVFDDFNHGVPGLANQIAGGRASTLFVLLSGIGLALVSGGRRPVQERARKAVAAGIVVRAALITAIGLALGDLVGEAADVDIILPYYGLLFLIAIPLLYQRPRNLVLLTVGLVAVAPVVVIWTLAKYGFADLGSADNPTFEGLFHHPVVLLSALLVTGAYPVVAFLAYLSAGLAIGRLDLSSWRVAAALLGGGTALAVLAQAASALVLFRMGGLAHLLDPDKLGSARAINKVLWASDGPVDSWWYFAVAAPHSTTPIDLLHTLGSAMAILGAALLLCQIRIITRLVRPLIAAGSMTLTLYAGHLFVLAAGLIDDQLVLFVVLTIAVLAFGHFWQRRFGQGPLERLVSVTSGFVRRRVAAGYAQQTPRPVSW